MRDPEFLRETLQLATMGAAVHVVSDDRQSRVGLPATERGHGAQQRLQALGRAETADEADHRPARRQPEFGPQAIGVGGRLRRRDAVGDQHQTVRREPGGEQACAHRLTDRDHDPQTTEERPLETGGRERSQLVARAHVEDGAAERGGGRDVVVARGVGVQDLRLQAPQQLPQQEHTAGFEPVHQRQGMDRDPGVGQAPCQFAVRPYDRPRIVAARAQAHCQIAQMDFAAVVRALQAEMEYPHGLTPISGSYCRH